MERQLLYEEDESLQSLIRVFHHLVSTQMYLATLEPRTDHILSSTIHLMSAINDMLDLLHDHGLHHHILSLPPRNITLTRLFRPIYRTLTVVERDAYEESDVRLINCLASPPFILPVLAPHSPTPTEPADDNPTPSPQSTALTLVDEPTDLHPAFHQGHTTSYPLELHLETPGWAHNPLRLQQLFVFSVTTKGIFVSTAWNMNALTAINALLLRGLHNQISSSTHSSVVRRHVEFLSLGSSSSVNEKSGRLKSH